jgi:hypothetical protein
MRQKLFKRLKALINNITSFRGKIVAFFLIFSFILSITIGSVCYFMVYNKMLSNTIDYVQQLASQISRNTELMIEEASKVFQLGNSDISFKFLYATGDRQEETMELIKLFKLYRDSYVLSKDIKNVYIMGTDGVGFSERHGINNINTARMIVQEGIPVRLSANSGEQYGFSKSASSLTYALPYESICA